MRTLYTVAFPTVDQAAARTLAAIRARHDRQAGVLGSHFTLLFGCDAVDEATYLNHARAIATTTRRIAFHCRDTEPDADDSSGYVFLVPDLGRDAVTALHDALYTGPMALHLRKDLDFVPHVTVGHGANLAEAQRLSDELNSNALDISGTIDTVVVGCLEQDRFVELARFALRP